MVNLLLILLGHVGIWTGDWSSRRDIYYVLLSVAA